MATAAADTTSVKLWDAPVRLIHWALVILLGVLWWTGEEGELEWHKLAGYAMLALLVLRLLWGFVGSETARFAHFLKGPGTIWRHLQGDTRGPWLGHNPLGGWSVVVLLALLAAQVGFGLIAQDVDGIESGPLSHLVEYDTADWAREWHHLLFNAILLLSALHVGAILFYLLIKRENLLAPMVTGTKRVAEAPAAHPEIAPWWRLLVCLAVAVAIAWWVSKGAPLPGGGG